MLHDAPSYSHDLVYTWGDSGVALSAADTIAITAKDQKDTQVCTLESVASLPSSDALHAALQDKVLELTQLELRIHPSWRPIVALYRFGLTALINGHPDQAKKLIAEADERRRKENDYREKLTDYMNWFEVTNDYSGNSSEFADFFAAAQELEKTPTDPKHPNPMRADLNRVESRL